MVARPRRTVFLREGRPLGPREEEAFIVQDFRLGVAVGSRHWAHREQGAAVLGALWFA